MAQTRWRQWARPITLMTFLTSILLGLCMGSGEQDRMRQSVFLSFVLIAGISLVLNVLMKEYLLIIFLGIMAAFLYNYFANLLRAIGWALADIIGIGYYLKKKRSKSN